MLMLIQGLFLRILGSSGDDVSIKDFHSVR